MAENETNRNADGEAEKKGCGDLRLLGDCGDLVTWLFAEAQASEWLLKREQFAAALERSAGKRFVAGASKQQLKEYFSTLHVRDLSLACACLEGCEKAWEHFVSNYRGYLRAAAGALLRRSGDSPEACELADSLFAELYGVGDSRSRGRSLFRYFHGRSSLKTWLRAILAQRHVDAIRMSRRVESIEGDGEEGTSQAREPAAPPTFPLDPNRERYRLLFCRALELAVASLDARDHLRVRLYYAEQQTLAEIGRRLKEHESSVSRNLDRIRAHLRQEVEAELRSGRSPANGSAGTAGLSEAEVELCIEYAAEDIPFDLEKMLRQRGPGGPAAGRREP